MWKIRENSLKWIWNAKPWTFMEIHYHYREMGECMEFYYNEFVMGDVKFMKIHYKWIGKREIHAN